MCVCVRAYMHASMYVVVLHSVVCIQLGASIRIIKEDHCELIHEATGRLTCDMVDRRVEREYNLTLDKLAEWRRGKPAEASLEGIIASYI